MAAGVPNEKVTRFPNGIGQFLFFAPGAAAGNVGCTGVLKARDVLLQVNALVFATNGTLTSCADYTNEFTILSNNFLNNTGGTSSANKVLCVMVARASA